MERPIFAEWIRAFGASLATAAVLFLGVSLFAGGLGNGEWLDLAVGTLRVTLLMFGPGAAAGSWVSVAVVRHFGSTKPWRSGWFLGVVLGGLTLWAAVSFLHVTL
ncbi:MAG: hypothetical protein ACYC6C_01175 [Coriobacteriia bacterium]